MVTAKDKERAAQAKGLCEEEEAAAARGAPRTPGGPAAARAPAFRLSVPQFPYLDNGGRVPAAPPGFRCSAVLFFRLLPQ